MRDGTETETDAVESIGRRAEPLNGGLAETLPRMRAPRRVQPRGRRTRGRRRRRLLWTLRGAALIFALGAIALAWAWRVTPSTVDLAPRLRAEIAARHEPYTPLARISPQVAHALIAIEDERFYQHHGIDVIGLARAAWADAQAGRIVQGGSTLTAQLAKNAYLNGYDHTVPLKLEDLLLAFKIERHYSKAQILELYLNYVYFGDNAYGIAEASQTFFGVAPARLDAAQGALLAGLVQAPGAYEPWLHPSAARTRQCAVLGRMLADGYLTPADYASARSEALPFWQGTHASVMAKVC